MNFRAASPKRRWYQQVSWGVRELGLQRRLFLECKRWRPLGCELLWDRDVRSETTWRESSSIHSCSMAVLSGVEGEICSL